MNYSETKDNSNHERETILIVDDEPINIKTISTLLKDSFNVKVANHGRTAIQVLKRERVDLILLDIMMPDIDGFEVAQIVKDSPNTKSVPIIFITAKRDQETMLHGFKLGAVDFVTKPFSREELFVRVETHISLHRLQKKLHLALSEAKLQLQIIDQYVNFSKTDLKGNIREVSTLFIKESGYTLNELIGKNHRIVKSGLTPKTTFQEMWNSIVRNRSWSGEIINKKRDGSIYYINSKISPEFDSDGNKVGYIGFYEDITDRKMVEIFAEQDFLTKIYNRQKIDFILNRESINAKNRGDSLSVMMLDIDHFKRVNDTFGHQVGDDVLIEFTKVVKKSLHERDMLGRFGGEEFIIVSPQLPIENASLLAETICKEIRDHTFPTVGKLTVSIGISSYRVGDTVETLVKRVDDALYQAKESGRDRVKQN